MDWSFNMPVSIYFGNGKLDELPDICEQSGYKKGVLVCDSFFELSGGYKNIPSYDKLFAARFSDFCPNPTVKNADSCAAVLRETKADFVLALGGGSAIDCAKAACAIAKTSDSIAEYHSGGKPLSSENFIPLIAAPTTAGTGSEVTPVTVLTDDLLNKKMPLGNPLLYPKIAIIDPLLTLSVPEPVTASTGLDVLSHALEAFWSIHHQPLCDALALSAVRTVFEFLPAAYKDGKDKIAREKMSEASLLAGIAFSHPKTSGPHACSFALTNKYKIPHGEACAFTLDSFLRINAEAEYGRLHSFAKDCGFANAFMMADRIYELKKSLKMKLCLSEAGIPNEDIAWLASQSMNANMLNNPIEMNEKSVVDLYSKLI